MKALFLCSLFLPSTGTYFLNELKDDLAVLSIGLESRRFCGVSAALKILLKVSMLKESGRLPLPCTCWVLKPSLEHTVAAQGRISPGGRELPCNTSSHRLGTAAQGPRQHCIHLLCSPGAPGQKIPQEPMELRGQEQHECCYRR